MTRRIGVCGGPGVGKTTLSRILTNRLSLSGYNSEYVQEYARLHINQCKKRNVPVDRNPLHQAVILHHQLQWEDAIPKAVDFMVTDSPILSYPIYCYAFTDFNDFNQTSFYHMYYQQILEHRNRYDTLFWLPPEIPFQSDGTRSEKPELAKLIGEKIRAFLLLHDISFIEVRGSLKERLDFCYGKLVSSKKDVKQEE